MTKFFQLPFTRQWLLLEAMIWVVLGKGAIIVIPFRRLAQFLGSQHFSAAIPLTPEQTDTATQIAWALRNVGHYLRLAKPCYPLALAGKTMLRYRGIPTTLYFGVKKGTTTGLNAHAWLKAGALFVSGAKQHKQYTIVGQFAS